MNNKGLILVTVSFCLIILIGEVYAYLPNDYGYSSSIDASNNEVTFSLNAPSSREYDAILIDNGNYSANVSIYLYYDESYASNVNEDATVEVGATQMTQKYYLEQVEKVLANRGMTNTIWLNAEELRDHLEKNIADDVCSSKGLIMASGSIPSILFSGSADDLLIKWISNGGSLYWTGNAIGNYISYEDKIENRIYMAMFTGTNKYMSSDITAYEDTECRSLLSYEYNHLLYSIDTSSTDRQVLLSGYTDGTYASTTFIGLEKGQVCIVGGEFNSKQIRDLSISVCSGLTCASKIVEVKHGIINSSYSDHITLLDTDNKLFLYLYIGGYFCVYGKGYALE